MLPILDAKVKDVYVEVLLDSGATVSCISKICFSIISCSRSYIPQLSVSGVRICRALINKPQVVRYQTYVKIKMKKISMEFPSLVVPGLVRKVIIEC